MRWKGVKKRKGEVVHHKDRDRSNNDPANLVVFKNQSEHIKWYAKNDPEWGVCKKWR